MLDPMTVPTFNPELYYTRQLRLNTHYPIYQSGRGFGSRLFSIVKSVGAPLLKDVILPTVKQEAGQVLKDITSGVGIKRALKQGAKRAGKSIDVEHNVSCKAKEEHVTLFANENGIGSESFYSFIHVAKKYKLPKTDQILIIYCIE